MSLFADRPIAGGLTLAGLALAPHLALDGPASVDLAALTLVIVAGIYLGFAIARGSGRWRLAELSVAGLAALAALAGALFVHFLIPAAFMAHGLWDRTQRNANRAILIARSRITFVAVMDWAIAAGLVALWVWLGEEI